MSEPLQQNPEIQAEVAPPVAEVDHQFDHLFGDEATYQAGAPHAVEDDAVRTAVSTEFNAGVEARRQMGINAADRLIRAEAGMPPRVHNLR
jgi:hypothetical protein